MVNSKKRGRRAENQDISFVKGVTDLTGHIFGSWKVLGLADIRRYGGKDDQRLWRCFCLGCNKVEREVYEGSLRYGTSSSCGCLKSKNGHLSKHPLYAKWRDLMKRKDEEPDKYRVCERWHHLALFYEDVLSIYNESHYFSLLLKDPEGEYCLDNCDVVYGGLGACHSGNRDEYIIYNDKRYTFSEISRVTGLSRQLLHLRKKKKLSDKDIVLSPEEYRLLHGSKRRAKFFFKDENGNEFSLADIASSYNCRYLSLLNYFYRERKNGKELSYQDLCAYASRYNSGEFFPKGRHITIYIEYKGTKYTLKELCKETGLAHSTAYSIYKRRQSVEEYLELKKSNKLRRNRNKKK